MIKIMNYYKFEGSREHKIVLQTNIHIPGPPKIMNNTTNKGKIKRRAKEENKI
jgi:hypothetical protein